MEAKGENWLGTGTTAARGERRERGGAEGPRGARTGRGRRRETRHGVEIRTGKRGEWI